MAKVKVGINGFGRIGRNLFRAAYEAGAELEFVAVNDITDAAHARPPAQVRLDPRPLPGRGRGGRRTRSSSTASEIKVLSERDPAELPVGRARRRRRDRVDRPVHQARGRRQAPRGGREEGDHLGAGHRPGRHRRPGRQLRRDYDPEAHNIISNASCTTNCLAPVAKVLNDAVGIERGLMTTIHAYTADQRLQDMPHKDLRRARAAAINLIPASTGAAKAVGLVLPELDGQAQRHRRARAGRRPARSSTSPSRRRARPRVEEINARGRARRPTGRSSGILAYTEDPIVSTDIVKDPHSSIFDSGADDRHGGQLRQGLLLVRQRVGLLEPLRRARREGARAPAGARLEPEPD